MYMLKELEKLIEIIKKFNINIEYGIESISELEECILNWFARDIKPKNKKKHVGIEIEFDSPDSEYELFQSFYKNNLLDKVSLTTDSSIESWRRNDGWNDNDGYEIRIIDEEKNIQETLKKVCKILKKHRAEINDECGLHIHIDIRNRNKEKVFNNLLKAQKLLYKIVLPKRINNSYCTYNDVNNPYLGNGHSKGIIKTSFNTIEIRIHHGTIDFNEINNWINILLKIANKKTDYVKFKTHKSIINTTTFNKFTKEYINKRLNLFKSGQEFYGIDNIINY